MRTRVAGILFKDEKLLTIHRIKAGREYYVFPGGGLEPNETVIAALKREMLEEVGIQVQVLQDTPIYTYQDETSEQLFFLVEYLSGEYGSGKGPEYTSASYQSKGFYSVEFVSLKAIKDGKIPLKPEEIKDKLIKDLKMNKFN